MPGWENFFVAQAGAAAALAGLVFVGVSINLPKIVGSGHLPNRALESLIILSANLLIASAFLVPEQSHRALGLEVLGLGALVWGVITTLHAKTLKAIEAQYRPQGLLAAAQSQIYALGILAAGAAIAWRGPVGAYVLTPPLLFGYYVALLNAWVLTIEINR